MHNRIIPAMLFSALSLGAHGQSLIQAATTGQILDASSRRLYQSAASGAWLQQSQARSNIQVRFADPLSLTYMSWGATVNNDSYGWRSVLCDKQKGLPPKDPGNKVAWWECVERTSEIPLWSAGLGPRAADAGGSFMHESSGTPAVPFNPQEVRFRALSHGGAEVQPASLGSGAMSKMDQGRTTTQAWLRFSPPWAPAPGRQVCTGDLVIELKYGIDGVHGPDAVSSIVAHRWLDLNVRYGPSWDYPNEPRGEIIIRPTGQPKTALRGTGWPERYEDPAIEQSTIYVDTSAGSRPPLTFSWDNGMVAFPGVPFQQVFDRWNTQIVRVPVTMRVPTAFFFDAMTQQRQQLSRSEAGTSTVPMANNPAGKGHGFDVRMYLDNLQPLQCRPDYSPPSAPPREPCVPTGNTGCWLGATGT